MSLRGAAACSASAGMQRVPSPMSPDFEFKSLASSSIHWRLQYTVPVGTAAGPIIDTELGTARPGEKIAQTHGAQTVAVPSE